MIVLTCSWLCSCGEAGDAATAADARRDFTVHANTSGCAHITLAELEALLDVDDQVYPGGSNG